MNNSVSNFVVVDSIHGKFIVNRHCDFQAEALIKTGKTHIEAELQNILAVVATLPPGAVALDAGANIGFVSVPIANALKDKLGRVLSFEVQTTLSNALCGTVALNDLENLHVFNQGLCSATGFVQIKNPIYSQPSDFGTFTLVNQKCDHINQGQTTIPIVRIDDLSLKRLDFLKIDVEGMEIDVLNGGRRSIDINRPLCWVEYWKSDPSKLYSFFTSRNYAMYTMNSLNVLCAPLEKHRASGLKINAPQFSSSIQ